MAVEVPLLVIRGNPVKRIAHVGAYIVVPVLVERERTAGVLDEQVQHADLVVADLGQFGQDMVGDEVGATAARGQSEVFLGPGHGVEWKRVRGIGREENQVDSMFDWVRGLMSFHYKLCVLRDQL